jgi:hypothetical protein
VRYYINRPVNSYTKRTASGPEAAGDGKELLLLADAPDEEEGVAEILIACAFPELCD